MGDQAHPAGPHGIGQHAQLAQALDEGGGLGYLYVDHVGLHRLQIYLEVQPQQPLGQGPGQLVVFGQVFWAFGEGQDARRYARLLAHLAKACTAEHGTYCTQLAMELFGGVGFFEDFAIARLAREALITPIWEGPANVQALDTLEVLFRKGAAEPFLAEFTAKLEAAGSQEAQQARDVLHSTLQYPQTLNLEGAQWQAREALRTLADAAIVALLYDLALLPDQG